MADSEMTQTKELGEIAQTAAADGEKTAKQLEREARKKAAKDAKANKAAGNKGRGEQRGPLVVTVVPNPPVGLEPCTGTRDFYPEDMRLRNWLFGQFEKTAFLTGFQQYDAPVLEHQELYVRKAGEEITDQMYAFKDKAEPPREVTLRPEMTPSVARMVLARGQAQSLPLKWFSIPQCWRYETTTRGRRREHYQWNMDIIGSYGISADVELLNAVCLFFASIGITSDEVGVKVNSRKVLASVLESFNVPAAKFAPVCVVVDKLDKIGAEGVKEQLVDTKGKPAQDGSEEVEGLGLDPETADKIIACLQAPDVDSLAALCGSADSAAVKELKELFVLAEHYGFRDYLEFDASVVRGLAYYTGVVFEAFDRRKLLRAIAGGGRYDGLMTLYGAAKEVPACGFGFGDCVIVELLKDLGKLPALPVHVDFVVAAYDSSMQGPAMGIAAGIRKGGSSVDMLLEPKKKVAQAFEYADRAGGDYMVFVAPDELEKKVVRVKDLRLPDSSPCKQVDIALDRLGDLKKAVLEAQTAADQADAAAKMAEATLREEQ